MPAAWPPRVVIRKSSGLRTLESALYRAGLGPVAGVDEVGRGACAGPLVVAACVLGPNRLDSLAALDDYAERRFGMPTAALWTRLWGVLSDKARTEVAEARHAVDALVNVLAALVGVMVWIVAAELHEALGALGPATLAFDLRPLLLLIAAALLARLVYASVLVALGGLRETMIRWIDLERFRLLRELGWPAVAYESDVFDAYSRLNTHLVLGWTLKPDFRVDPTDATK